jgi:hypothetical protein
MRISMLLVFVFCLSVSAQTPEAKPTEAPKRMELSNEDNMRVENIQLRFELLSKDLNALFAQYCMQLGGKSPQDCITLPPSQSSPRYSVQLKPTLAIRTPAQADPKATATASK